VTRTRRTAVAVLLAFACGAGAAAVLASRGAVLDASAPTVIDTSFQSRALDATLHLLVVLPAGYATSGLRYPVVYFLHGLPAGPTAYRSVAWVGTAVQQTGRQAIVVIPQGARAQNGDP
jgi:enterochelin esterase-like enzyme